MKCKYFFPLLLQKWELAAYLICSPTKPFRLFFAWALSSLGWVSWTAPILQIGMESHRAKWLSQGYSAGRRLREKKHSLRLLHQFSPGDHWMVLGYWELSGLTQDSDVHPRQFKCLASESPFRLEERELSANTVLGCKLPAHPFP